MIIRILQLLILSSIILFSCKSGNDVELIVEIPKEQDSAVISSPKVLTEATLDLTRYGVANNPNNVLGGLSVGDVAPDFSLYNHKGDVINLDQKLNQGPIILVFYRADWCPYCSKHLIDFKNRLTEIHRTGLSSVIAVTPQRKAFSAKLIKENRIIFPILHDDGHTVMKKYKVFFHATKAYNKKVKDYHGQSIEEMNGDMEPVLCVPATYIIGQDRKIKYVHYDPDYTQRADVQEVIDNLY